MNLADVVKLVYAPVRAIQSKVEDSPKLLFPLLVFLLVLFFDFLNNWILATKMLDVFPLATDSVKGKMHLWLMQHVAQQEIQLMLLLFLGTGILMCLAVLLDGVGNYRKLLELIASCHVTLLVFELYFLGFALWYNPQNVFSDLNKMTPEAYEKLTVKNRELFDQNAKKAVEDERERVAFKVTRTLKHLSYLWLALLSTMVMMHAAKLSMGKALGSVGGLALFYILLQYLPTYLMKT